MNARDLPFSIPADEASRDHLAALGQIAGGLAHELKNPLGAIELNAQMLQRQFKDPVLDPAKALARIDRILKGTENLKRIVGSFLAYARPGRPDRERVDLNQLLQELLDEQDEVLTAAGVGVSFHPDENLAAVPADRVQLRSVFLNIILNARDAMRDAPAGKPRKLLIATRNRSSRRVSVVIANNGPPLSAKAATRLFEPFYSEKEEGTGLGLAIVRRVIELHRGQVKAASDPDQGVSFTIELPTNLGRARVAAQLSLAPIREAEVEPPTTSTRRRRGSTGNP